MQIESGNPQLYEIPVNRTEAQMEGSQGPGLDRIHSDGGVCSGLRWRTQSKYCNLHQHDCQQGQIGDDCRRNSARLATCSLRYLASVILHPNFLGPQVPFTSCGTRGDPRWLRPRLKLSANQMHFSQRVVLVALMAALSWSCGKAPPPPNEFGAETICRNFTKQRLKSSELADFSGVEETKRLSSHSVPVTFLITGWVDVQNSFGAVTRNRYSCSVKVENGRWSLIALDLQ